jgi:biopolymer transport protein ExbB
VIESGGEIGWVIVAGGVLALVFACLRALLLLPNAVNARRVVEEMAPHLSKKHFGAALAIAEKTRGALGRVLAATLRSIERSREQLEDTVDEAVLHETPRLDRFGNAIFVIAAVSPLLGLLGTVTGMIATFDIITEFGTGNPKLLSSGISIALVTTELGLIVAIPALVIGNFLGGWAEQIKEDLDRAALRVINLADGGHIVPRPTEDQAPASDINKEALAAS